MAMLTSRRHASGANQGRRRTGRPATAAVEFALFLPFLLTLFLGMTELSRGIMVKAQLNNAARKGCRTGILATRANSDITSDVTGVMRDNGFNATLFNPPSVGSITIRVTDPGGTALGDTLDAPGGSTVSVKVSLPVPSFMWLTSYFLTTNEIESETVVMMKQ